MGGEKPTESWSLPSKRAVKVYRTVALRRFALKLPRSSQELMTALKHKKARRQGRFFFSWQGRGAVRDEKDATDNKRRFSTCSGLRLKQAPEHAATTQMDWHCKTVNTCPGQLHQEALVLRSKIIYSGPYMISPTSTGRSYVVTPLFQTVLLAPYSDVHVLTNLSYYYSQDCAPLWGSLEQTLCQDSAGPRSI